jgi:hypothetical protein
MFVFPELIRLRQESPEFKTSLAYIKRSCLKKTVLEGVEFIKV